MACKQNEYALLKGVAAELDKDTMIMTAMLYHTEVDPTDPEGKRNDRSKSEYRYETRILKKIDLEKEIAAMNADDGEWTWPGLTGKTICYAKYSSAKRGAKWLQDRIKKMMSYEDYWKLVSEGVKKGGSASKNAKYDLVGYTDGTKTFDIGPDAAAMLAIGCGNYSKIVAKKSQS